MGFRDVIAHQYFDLDAEQVLLICQEALPGVLDAIRSLEALSRNPFEPTTYWPRQQGASDLEQ